MAITLKLSPEAIYVYIGQTQTFNAEISGDKEDTTTSYKWFVDGKEQSEVSNEFSITPTKAGESIIKVQSKTVDNTGTDEDIITEATSKLIVEKKDMDPVASIEVDKTEVEAGDKVKFNIKITKIPDNATVSYLWDTGETTNEVELITSVIGEIKKECKVTVEHPDYSTRRLNISSPDIKVNGKTMNDVTINVIINPEEVKIGEEYEVEAIVTGGPSDKSIKYEWNTGHKTNIFKTTAKEPGEIKHECRVVVTAKNYYPLSLSSISSISIKQHDPESIKYIHPLDQRDSAYLWQGWWVMKEIESAVEKGIDWKNPDSTDLNYKCDLKTIAYMLDNFPNIEIQESKNGYILNKSTIESGYIY